MMTKPITAFAESRDHPGQGDGEQDKRGEIEDSKSAGRQRHRGEP